MKLYELNNEVYQEPLPIGFNLENAVEITSPIKNDGTIWNSHPDKSMLEMKNIGTKEEPIMDYFTHYNQDGTCNKDIECDSANEIINIEIAKKIQALEMKQLRPLRELSIDNTNDYAKSMLNEIESNIQLLRLDMK